MVFVGLNDCEAVSLRVVTEFLGDSCSTLFVWKRVTCAMSHRWKRSAIFRFRTGLGVCVFPSLVVEFPTACAYQKAVGQNRPP